MKKRSLSTILAIIMAITMLAGCGGSDVPAAQTESDEPSTAPVSSSPSGNTSMTGNTAQDQSGAEVNESDRFKDTVIIGMSESCPSMDPHSNTDQSSKILYKVMHLPLVVQDENLLPAPGLAERWEQEDDTTYIFYLRKGVKFHNGDEAKAADVGYTFTRGKDSSFLSTVVGAIESITAIDEYTVKIVNTAVNPDFIYQLYNYNYVILSERACTEDPEHGFEIGCGPYKLDEFILNDHASFSKYEGYFDPDRIRTDHLLFRYIPENSTRVIALENGEIDVCLNPSNIDITYIEQNPKLTLYMVDQTNIGFIAFNLNLEKSQNKLVRQAISCAINKDDIITMALEGLGMPAKSFWIPAVFGFADDFDTYEYDLDRAKALMAQSGVTDVSFVATVPEDLYVRVGEILIEQLKEIGVNMTVSKIESAAQASFLAAGEHEISLRGNSYSIPMSAYNMLYPGKGTNYTFYDNPDVCKLLDQASVELDTAKREALYREVQIIVAEEVPYIPLFYKVLVWGAVNGFGGLIANPSGPHDFSFCYVIEN